MVTDIGKAEGQAEASSPESGLKLLAMHERPQERLERHGARALSDTELLAMLLRSGSRGTDVLAVAASLLDNAGSLGGLLRFNAADFRRQRGLGPVKSLQLMAVMELARRILARDGTEDTSPVFGSAEAVYAFMVAHTAGLDVEKLWTLTLNRRNRLLRLVEVTSGTASQSLAHPREVFREAVRAGASAVIVVHNHPSGDPFPSTADIRTTRALREAADVLNITLKDHVIVGEPCADTTGRGYYSFEENGLLA